jgi:hypothetical protein
MSIVFTSVYITVLIPVHYSSLILFEIETEIKEKTHLSPPLVLHSSSWQGPTSKSISIILFQIAKVSPLFQHRFHQFGLSREKGS